MICWLSQGRILSMKLYLVSRNFFCFGTILKILFLSDLLPFCCTYLWGTNSYSLKLLWYVLAISFFGFFGHYFS